MGVQGRGPCPARWRRRAPRAGRHGGRRAPPRRGRSARGREPWCRRRRRPRSCRGTDHDREDRRRRAARDRPDAHSCPHPRRRRRRSRRPCGRLADYSRRSSAPRDRTAGRSADRIRPYDDRGHPGGTRCCPRPHPSVTPNPFRRRRHRRPRRRGLRPGGAGLRHRARPRSRSSPPRPALCPGLGADAQSLIAGPAAGPARRSPPSGCRRPTSAGSAWTRTPCCCTPPATTPSPSSYGPGSEPADEAARACSTERGAPVSRGRAGSGHPFPHEEAPGYLGTALAFHFINRDVGPGDRGNLLPADAQRCVRCGAWRAGRCRRTVRAGRPRCRPVPSRRPRPGTGVGGGHPGRPRVRGAEHHRHHGRRAPRRRRPGPRTRHLCVTGTGLHPPLARGPSPTGGSGGARLALLAALHAGQGSRTRTSRHGAGPSTDHCLVHLVAYSVRRRGPHRGRPEYIRHPPTTQETSRTIVAEPRRAEAWNGPAGAHRAGHQDRYGAMRCDAMRYDAMPAGVNDALVRRGGRRPGDRVLDVGCGAGATTRIAARLAAPGTPSASTSRRLCRHGHARARRWRASRTRRTECADARVRAFPAGGYDVVVSRGGGEVLRRPCRRLRNLVRALRPGGRLAFVCPRPPGPESEQGRALARLSSTRPARDPVAAARDGLVVGSGARPGGPWPGTRGDDRPVTVETVWGRDVRDAAEFLLSRVPGGALPPLGSPVWRRPCARSTPAPACGCGPTCGWCRRSGPDAPAGTRCSRSSASPRGPPPSSPFRPTGSRVTLASRPQCGPSPHRPPREVRRAFFFPCRSP